MFLTFRPQPYQVNVTFRPHTYQVNVTFRPQPYQVNVTFRPQPYQVNVTFNVCNITRSPFPAVICDTDVPLSDSTTLNETR